MTHHGEAEPTEQSRSHPLSVVTNYTVSPFMLPHNTALEDVEQVARTGGAGVGISFAKLGGQVSDQQMRDALTRHGLRATFCVPQLWTILPTPPAFGPSSWEKDPKVRTRQICAELERAAAFDPVAVIIGSGTSGDPQRPAGPLSAVADGLAQIADVAMELGLQISLELFGKRRGTPITNLDDIVKFIDDIARPNVGIAFDIFQSWPDEGLHDALRRHARRIINVDVCDVRFEERSGFDRELPGRGRNVAPAIVASLLEGGYTGWWKLEVFSDDGTYGNDFPDSYWKIPHEDLLRLGHDAFSQVLHDAKELAQI
jgi:sugar phosphate isomerase/epimerase